MQDPYLTNLAEPFPVEMQQKRRNKIVLTVLLLTGAAVLIVGTLELLIPTTLTY
jgi:hypothetical protein